MLCIIYNTDWDNKKSGQGPDRSIFLGEAVGLGWFWSIFLGEGVGLGWLGRGWVGIEGCHFCYSPDPGGR